MDTTLERLFNKYFKTFADNHFNIKSFRTKPITEFVASDWVYPLMWIDLQSVNTAFQSGQMVTTIPAYFLDRVERDYSNLLSVMSSTLLTSHDFFTYCTDQFMCDAGFYFQDNAVVTPNVYEFDDLVAGFTMTVPCNIRATRNENRIPFE